MSLTSVTQVVGLVDLAWVSSLVFNVFISSLLFEISGTFLFCTQFKYLDIFWFSDPFFLEANSYWVSIIFSCSFKQVEIRVPISPSGLC